MAEFTAEQWLDITFALRHTYGGNYPLAELTQAEWERTRD